MTGFSNPFVALITGAARGIGAATARRLAAEPGCRLVLVDRDEGALCTLTAELPVPATSVAVDLTLPAAPARIRDHVLAEHNGLHLLVNNAGARWTARFGDGGWENIRRTMAINFDAAVRLTEALLPLLHKSAPSGIVNVSSVGGRVARPGAGAYAASKAALAAWSDSLSVEEEASGVNVGVVFPGYAVTEGFPQRELLSRRATRWLVSEPADIAEAIVSLALQRKSERYVPRGYVLAAAARILFPGAVHRALASKRASFVVPQSAADAAAGNSDTSVSEGAES